MWLVLRSAAATQPGLLHGRDLLTEDIEDRDRAIALHGAVSAQ
jgi:hypothetical protein